MSYLKGYKHWDKVSKKNEKIIILYCNYLTNLEGKAETTIEGTAYTLIKLAEHLKNKPLKKATEKDLQEFFTSLKCSDGTKDQHGSRIMKFYRWTFELKKKRCPENMEWFHFQTEKQKLRSKDPKAKEKQFVTTDEYQGIISKTINLHDKALFETLYLSGPRPDEICSMNINDVHELDKGWEITVKRSKTEPRNIALDGYPEHLLRWVENHPNRDNKESPLFMSRSRIANGRMTTKGIESRLITIIKDSNIKKTITPKSFRATRATIMFGDTKRNFTGKEMALHFGWRPKAVPERREQYDLTDYEDLKKKVFGKGKKRESSDAIKGQNEKLRKNNEKYENEINDLKEQMEALVNMIKPFFDKRASKDFDENPDEQCTSFSIDVKDYNP